jgi:hypothetical protein
MHLYSNAQKLPVGILLPLGELTQFQAKKASAWSHTIGAPGVQPE